MTVHKGRRAWADERRVRTHIPAPDDAGCCTICHLPAAAPNRRHVDELPRVDPDITAAEHRRIAERD